jgi:hypothetical protein
MLKFDNQNLGASPPCGDRAIRYYENAFTFSYRFYPLRVASACALA